MADIVNPEAIKFTNESVRPLADALGRCYYWGVLAKQMYDGAGGGAPALAVPGIVAQIRKAADQWRSTYAFAYEREVEWFLKGAATLIPNTIDNILDNNGTSQRTDAPLATGQKVNNLIARVTQFVNAVRSATFNFTDATRNSVVNYNKIIVVTKTVGLNTMSIADAQNFVDDVALLKTNYEATANANLNQILALAINPGNGG